MQQLKQFDIVPFNHSALLEILKHYKSPNDKISQLIKKSEIIKLKKGLYINGVQYHSNPISKELIANLIYGPSYISLESALSFYGLIPEKVFTFQSITTKRARKFKTPLGLYNYFKCKPEYFPIGVVQKKVVNEYNFLIAAPSKALCDKLVFTKNLKIISKKGMKEYLLEDLRIDQEDLKSLDLSIIKMCLNNGKKSRKIELLYEIVNQLNN
jgi:hypothetical protein